LTNLNTEIQFLKGVGEKKAQLFNTELGIYTIEDLLYYFPYKYIDKSKILQIKEIHSALDFSVQIKGRISRIETIGTGRAQRLSAQLSDHTGSIQLVWFKGIKWVKSSLKEGIEYMVFGKPTLFNGKFNITHPELEPFNSYDASTGVVPQYSISEKLKTKFITSKVLEKLTGSILKGSFYVKDYHTESFLKEHKLLDLTRTLTNIHFPKNQEHQKAAEYRIKFDELYFIQLKLLLKKGIQKSANKGHLLEKIGPNFNTYFSNHLEFELTNAQKRVIKEIRADVKTGKQMNRLLQGDVGSGKTLVALFSMLMAVDNGYQAAMMAPTEILAKQHYDSLKDDIESIGLKIHLLTGSTKQSERKIIHQDLLSGEAHILVGTHALIEDTVQFKNLALVVIDEQHRFGVAQRAKFWRKNTIPPHILIMTATPIPRTLSMTLYGDLDVSIIDELPPGRKSIITQHFYETQQPRINKFIRDQIKLGRQIYVVYPLIKESEKLDYKALEEGFWTLNEDFPAPEYAISIVHGQIKPQDKEMEMQKFIKGHTHIMVATTVIEVGVNVPNASVMIIESAERFGLSQLHQLRGRVGRGADQSYCILKTSYKLSKDSRTRIEAMVNSTDGFKLAEIDLQLRGPGSIEGTQQSGVPLEFKKANLATDQNILISARAAAEEVLESDPQLQLPENQATRNIIKSKYSSKINWSKIG
jgi:ATP-dependent DNA helicase RecG